MSALLNTDRLVRLELRPSTTTPLAFRLDGRRTATSSHTVKSPIAVVPLHCRPNSTRSSVDFWRSLPGTMSMGCIQRREFLITAGALLAAPFADAQPERKMARIGVLMVGDPLA